MLERLEERGDLETHAQPEVFYIDPQKVSLDCDRFLV